MEENPNKSERAKREEEMLAFWKEKDIFSKTLKKESPKGEFIFFEGPPTANGRPAIHHLEARAFKDAIPRYKTMRGYKVRRKAGWDTHGLPVELEVEKTLGLQSKKEIEEYGVDKFNEECKKSVWKYVDEWQKFTDRVGYWVDISNAYVTYHNSYIEASWSIMKEVEKKGLLYKDYKVVPYCPRCGTGLSSHELAQGYKDVKETSVYVKFKIVNEENKYLLAWTTTPWTLPGNVALAVGKDMEYVEVKSKGQESGESLILAKSRLVILGEEYEVLREMRGEDLLGLEYEPLYPYTKEQYTGEGLDNAYKVYAASFVTTEDGTGIVHTAVMYGQEDFDLGQEIGLPKHHIVHPDGTFIKGTGFLEGAFVKDEGTTVAIIKDLASRNLLFKKEKYEHSYPHCWRCQTPLIYYARDSWYIKMSSLRNKLVEENEKINWEPDHIKEGRFGEWIKEIKDWAISRERYWGTPLPIWIAESGMKFVVSSVDEIKKYRKTNGNKFLGIRHGEADYNVSYTCSSTVDSPDHLTEKGRSDVLASALTLKDKKITKIISSPFVRTRETAEIVAEAIGLAKSEIIFDDRLREFDFGEFNQKDRKLYDEWRKSNNTPDARPEGGENAREALRRFAEALYDIDATNSNETILLVTHGIGFEVLPAAAKGETAQEMWNTWVPNAVKHGEVVELDFIPLPHNADFELDLHKPYIDDVVLEIEGEEYRRVKEVMDVWFDSGAMPFAQDASEREKPGDFSNIAYPADFISEGIDQTRGWFYTLHAIGALMDRGAAFQNAICLGLIMDKDGKKMSKSVGNVVDPWIQMDKYGVDTLRLWMYSVNQPGDSKNYDERTVDEIQKKIFNLIDNVHSFYEMYKGDHSYDNEGTASTHVLDKWIVNRLSETTSVITSELDRYRLMTPVRQIQLFVDDLSTWYLRRSRDRIKEGSEDAKATLYLVLKTLSKLLAPFAPLYSENLYQKLRTANDPESVHLDLWPEETAVDSEILRKMELTRSYASQALEKRSRANIKVRQPLGLLKIKESLGDEYSEVIKEELNVKEVVVDEKLDESVWLDTTLTPLLEEEGKVREEIRLIQDMRKEKGLKPGDIMPLEVPTDKTQLYQKYASEIKKATNTVFN